MFLTPAELQQLTGRQRKHSQIRCLKKCGIPYTLNADGRPVVLHSSITGLLRPNPNPKLRLPQHDQAPPTR